MRAAMPPSGGLPYPLGNPGPSTLSPLARPFTVARAIPRSNSTLAPAESAPPAAAADTIAIARLGEDNADPGWSSSHDIESGEPWESGVGGLPWPEPSPDMHPSPFTGGINTISQPSYVYPSSDHWPSSTSSCMMISAKNNIPTSDNGLKEAIPYGGYYGTEAVDHVESVPGCNEFRENESMSIELFKDETGVRQRDSVGVSTWMNPSFGHWHSFYPIGLWKGKYDETSLGKKYTDLNRVDWLSGAPHSEFLDEKTNIPSDIPSTSFHNSTSLLGGLPCSESSVSISGANAFNCSSTKSCYSSYIEQLDSCLTSQTVSCSYASSNIIPGYDHSPRSLVPSECRNGAVFNFSKKPYSISFENNENGFLYNSRSSEIHRENTNAETSKVWNMDNFKASLFDFFPPESDKSLSNELPMESFTEHNKMESGSRTVPPNASTSSTLENVSAEHICPVEEVFDQLNMAEDSPCWKGASTSRLSPFTDCEILGSIVVSEDSKEHKNSAQDAHLFFGSNSEAPFSLGGYRDACFVANDKCGSPPCLGKPYEDSSSIRTPEKLSDYNLGSCSTSMIDKERSNCFSILEEHQMEDAYNQDNFESKCSVQKEINEETNHISITCPALSTTLPNDGHKKADPNSSSDLDICIEAMLNGSTLPDFSAFHEINESCSCEMLGKCSVHAKDIKHLVRAMHCLSEVILSTFSLDGSIMSKQDYDLLKLVNKNLEISMTRSKKDAAEVTSYISGQNTVSAFKHSVDPTTCEAKEVTPDMSRTMNLNSTGIIVEQNRDKATNGYRRSHHSTCPEVSCSSLSHEGTGSDMPIPSVVPQALQEELKRRFLGCESPEPLLYKDLWIQAEASVCRLKYELQLLRMEKNLVPKEQAEEANSLLRSDMVLGNLREDPCAYVSYSMEDAAPCEHAKPNEESISKTCNAYESEASVTNRLSILKGRMDNSSSTCIDTDNIRYFPPDKHIETGEAIFATNTCSEYPSIFPSGCSNQKFGCDVTTCLNDSGKGCGPLIKSPQYSDNAAFSLGVPKQVSATSLDTYKPFVPLYTLDIDQRQFAGGRSGSSSSEWEHVHREEINW